MFGDHVEIVCVVFCTTLERRAPRPMTTSMRGNALGRDAVHVSKILQLYQSVSTDTKVSDSTGDV